MFSNFQGELFMLLISGIKVDVKPLLMEYGEDSIEAKTLNKMVSSREAFSYNSLNQLKFELNMRKNIISASIELNDGYMKFKTFKEAFCNKAYWELTKGGGFKLKKDTTTSEGISDIFKHSSKYGTECSTAIVILYYRAILNIFPEGLFNKTFQDILLLNWHNLDDDLRIYSHETEDTYLPGDCLYFENPDYDPKKQEWQGENVIDLGDGTYYGHGIGIKDEKHLITALNKHRKPGAEKGAYLTKYVARPNFKHLFSIYMSSLKRLRLEYLRSYSFYRY
jgi:protein-glutamine gamma-glutamyltransferase